MKTLRRYDMRNRDYFLTLVTYHRRNILLRDVGLFWDSWKNGRPSAWVILPDHCHVIINSGDIGISDMVHHFKIAYSRIFRDRYEPGRVWQNRFWDHMIRDQDDMNRHLDYIHLNPVKHGFVNDPRMYENSSLHIYMKQEKYGGDWSVAMQDVSEGEFGE